MCWPCVSATFDNSNTDKQPSTCMTTRGKQGVTLQTHLRSGGEFANDSANRVGNGVGGCVVHGHHDVILSSHKHNTSHYQINPRASAPVTKQLPTSAPTTALYRIAKQDKTINNSKLTKSNCDYKID